MTDGYTSSSLISNFIQKINSNAEIEYLYSYNKEHGLTYKMISEYVNNYFDLILIPDASIDEDKDYNMIIKNNSNIKILILDHHEVKNRFDKYCVTVNCMYEPYPNHTLSGVGVVMKFCEAYCRTYNIDEKFLENYYDLVATGMISDAMSMKNLENRYYIVEGLKKENFKNDFLLELKERKKEEFVLGITPISIGWVLGPLINGVVRYGKDKEQRNMLRAMAGEQEEIEYQPRRKSIKDPKPEKEIHTLQWDMARTCVNVKQRQDNAVRDFMKQIEEKIKTEHLDENSVLFIDSSDIIDKKTVSGLVANKIAFKYCRPVVIMRDKSSTEFGGSGRGYDKSNIENFSELLKEAGCETAGHSNAFGCSFLKKDLSKIIKYCNEKYPLNSLETVHSIHWEIPANELRKGYIQEVAESYQIWGNDIEQPIFAITNLKINASAISGYGEGNNFIRFVYNGIPFIKKYCKHGEFEEMTMSTRNTFGKNKKNLVLNIIGQFVLNSWEGKINSEVKILYFDVKENKEDVIEAMVEKIEKAKNENEKVKNIIKDFEIGGDKETREERKEKKKIKIDLEDDDFIF